MIRVLVKGGGSLVDLEPGPDFVLPPDTGLWIDLFNPSRDEELAL